MSRILIIGDPHLKASNLNNVKLFLSWIGEVVSAKKPDMVVFLGDMFHTHAVIRSEIMALVTDHVLLLSKHAECFILVGNHDMASHRTPDLHAWIPFKNGYHNLHIIDAMTSIDAISYLPYIDSHEDFDNQLSKAMSESDLIFCHQTFRDANFGFITAKEGTTVPSDYDGLIIAGHIHKQQQIAPVWYPGTPYAQEASDADEVKGINLLNTVTGNIEFIRSPLPQWVNTVATMSDYESMVLSMVKSDKNHLVLTGPAPELAALMDTRRFKELKKEYGFSVKKQPSLGNSDNSCNRLKSVTTLESSVVQYIDTIYDGDVDREALKAKCLEVLK